MCAATETLAVVALDELVDQLEREGLRVVGSEWHPPALPVVYVVEIEDGKDERQVQSGQQ